MFFRLFKYNVIRNVRSKEILCWDFFFPILLGTLFFVTFGNSMDKSELFQEIPVAYVEENAADTEFSGVLQQIEEGDEPWVDVTKTTFSDAKELLADGEVEGIYYNSGEGITLYIEESGIEPSILKAVLESYQREYSTIATVAATHPELLDAVLEGVEQQADMITDETYTDGKMDDMMSYFYALIAMSCLYGCFMGVNCAVESKADLTAVAARRVAASTDRFVTLAADISSALLLQFICSAWALIYLKYVLKVEMGNKLPYLMLLVFVGAYIGVATGFFIGSFGKQSRGTKSGIAIAVTMLECFFSGLMVANMYYVIQEYCPLLNKINPASLLVDAMYSLDIYPTLGRFYQNLSILLVIAVLLSIGSFLAVRRERYASL